MAQVGGDDPKAKLEKIKKQLSAGTGSVLLHGPLLKRSETLRKWNQRWFTLDPSTGKMEYRFQRGDPSPRGLIYFDADSTITVSPLNIHGDRKYDGCCFYVGTAQKKESFLCAETPAAARAWVASLRAAALVLKAHKDAVNSLSGNGNAKLGTVAASVAAANATAQEAMKDIQASFRPSVVGVSQSSTPAGNVSADNSTILKETLRVKDEELNQLQRDIKARDLTIKELAERLSEMADAVESGAKAIHLVDKDRQVALSEVEHMKKELLRAAEQIKAAEERVVAANKTRDLALQEAHRWRVELGKAREQCVIWEGAVQRGHEHARQLKKAHEQELARLAEAQELRSSGPQVDAKVQEESRSTPKGSEVDAKVQAESPSTPKGSEVDTKVQAESPSTPKGSIIPALSEPHAAASPRTPEAEGSVPPPLEHTNATPQAKSAEAYHSSDLMKGTPEAESTKADLSSEATPEAESTKEDLSLWATPQAGSLHAPEPAVSGSTSPHEPPTSEEFHEVAESHPEEFSSEEAPVIPLAPVIPEATVQAEEASTLHTGEIPMNESGS